MKKLHLVAGLILLAGCKGADQPARTSQGPEYQGETWERVQGTQGVALKLHATNAIQTATSRTTPILYVGCGGLATALMITVPDNVPGSKSRPSRVQVALDRAAPVQQKWFEFADDLGRHWSPISAEARLHLLMQMLDAKTLRVDLSSNGASPQTATFNVQGFRASFTHEPTCATWRDPAKYR